MAGTAQVVEAQLVEHDEENVFSLAGHGDSMLAMRQLSMPHPRRDLEVGYSNFLSTPRAITDATHA